MSEADILAQLYEDVCVVYRPVKSTNADGESVFRKGLEGDIVYRDVRCGLSSASGGRLERSQSTANIDMDYVLFTKPGIDIQANDTVKVSRCGVDVVLIAGNTERHPSHNKVMLRLGKDKA